MKRNKFFLQITIFILAFFLCFEQSSVYIDEVLWTRPVATVKSTEEMPAENITKYIIEKAEKEDIDIFVSDSKSRSDIINEKKIYSSEKVRYILIKKHKILSGKYNSVLDTGEKIEFKDLKKFQSENDLISVFFLSGTDESRNFIKQVNRDLSEYGVKVDFNKYDNEIRSEKKIAVIWSLVGVALLILTVYDVAYQKKESTVKAIHGENLVYVVFKNIVSDLLICSATALISFFVFKFLYGNYPFIKETVFCIGIIEIINSVCYLPLLNINVKKDLSVNAGNGVIYSSYVLKLLSIFISMILIVLSLSSLSHALHFFKTTKIYSEMSGRKFISIQPDELNGEDIFGAISIANDIGNKIYINYYDSANPVMFSKAAGFGESDVVFVNSNAEKYLETFFDFDKSFKGLLVFAPEKYKGDTLLSKLIESFCKNYGLNEKTVLYAKSMKVSVLDNEFNSENMESDNPIVFYFNIDSSMWKTLLDDKNEMLQGNFQSIAFNLNESDIEDIKKNFSLNSNELIITNFDEQYNTQLGIVKAKTAACMVMLVFTMIFELQISKIALTMRYISHGKEYALKKVSGYGNIQIHLGSILAEIFTLLCAASLSLAFIRREGLEIAPGSVTAGITTELFFCVVSFCIMLKKTGIDRVNKILKGGML